MIILGIGGILGDAAAAVLKDGRLVAAVEQKKIARHQRPGDLPDEAIASCLAQCGARPDQVDCVAIARPFAVGLETPPHLALRSLFPNSRIVVVEHHVAHAASVYYASDFDSATVLTLDRAGDFRCGALWTAQGNQLRLEKELYYPDSLADLYGRVTALLGLEPRADEHKVQWISASGEPRYLDLFLEMLPAREGQWPRLERIWFHGERHGHGGFSARFYHRLGLEDGASIPAKMAPHVAASLQGAVEKLVLEMAGSGENLCLAGGLMLNVLLVAALERSGQYRNVFVQPAAGNAGTALGAVFHAWHQVYGETARAGIGDFCLGPEYTAEEIKRVVENCKVKFRYLLTTEEVIGRAVEELQKDRIVAWMHGRMEFGPRALGNRSILASPLNPYSTENLNTYIKHRESYRKFAASVPEELVSEFFEVGPNARLLATVGRVKPAHRKTFEPATLGQDTIRVHTVRKQDNPFYWLLLHRAAKVSGLPVLYNTSFNLFGDPLVCTPRDAVRSFYSSGIDTMFIGHFLLEK